MGVSGTARALRLSFFRNSHSFILLSTRPSTRRAPTRARDALVRLVRLPVRLEPVDLQRAEQRPRKQWGDAHCRWRTCPAASRSGPEPRRNGDTGGRAGGGGEAPAQRASHRHVHPLAAAAAARGTAHCARRAGTEIELDWDVFERACSGCERQLERACCQGG